MEYNPVTDEILVGDYWNFKIRRYNRVTGKQIGAFFRPVNLRRGQPYTISVNPVSGDIYVPEWGDGQKFSGAIGHYDKFGTYLNEIRVPAAYHVWTHVDAQGYLWVADSHSVLSFSMTEMKSATCCPSTSTISSREPFGTRNARPSPAGIRTSVTLPNQTSISALRCAPSMGM